MKLVVHILIATLDEEALAVVEQDWKRLILTGWFFCFEFTTPTKNELGGYWKAVNMETQETRNNIKKCNAWLPPGYGEKCGKEVDSICKEQCFEHCYGKGYPETHYLRCKNPSHSPYEKSEWQKQWEATQERTKKEREAKKWKYPYDKDISNLSKSKLRNAIKRDIKLLKASCQLTKVGCQMSETTKCEMEAIVKTWKKS